MKNVLTVLVLAFICAFSINTLTAQNVKEEHKVIVVEKVIDENGDVTEKKIVKEGEEAKKYMNKMTEKEYMWNEELKDSADGKRVRYKLMEKKSYETTKIKKGTGEESYIFEGDEDMPEEVKKMMMKSLEGKDPQKARVMIMRKNNGGEETVDVEITGDDIPEELEKMLREENIFIKKRTSAEEVTGGKPGLGVLISDDDKGILVNDVIPNTAAHEAGIKEGDRITKINGQPMKGYEQLVDKMGEFELGEKITVSFLRGDVELNRDVILNTVGKERWEEIILEIDEEEEK